MKSPAARLWWVWLPLPFILGADGTLSNIEPFFLGYGVLGAMFILVMIGWLAPRWVIDEYRARLLFKDQIIKEQASALARIADQLERRGYGGRASKGDQS